VFIWFFKYPARRLFVAGAGQVSKFHSESGRVFTRFYSKTSAANISQLKREPSAERSYDTKEPPNLRTGWLDIHPSLNFS
jgi:hypothetical protein